MMNHKEWAFSMLTLYTLISLGLTVIVASVLHDFTPVTMNFIYGVSIISFVTFESIAIKTMIKDYRKK